MTKSDTSFATTTLTTAVPVADDKEYELTASLLGDDATSESLFLDKPVKTLDTSRFASLANLPKEKITWTDTFFDDDDDDDIIAVFDFDYDAMESFYTSVGWATLGATILYTPFFVASLLGLAPCYLKQNVRWATRSQHVAITRDGIRFVREKRPCCWGLPCMDQGKSSKTVPFDKITDCDITEPAGNTCICITNVLSTVNVDTASSGTEGKKELKLAGLKDPHSFKKMVWAMKRAQQQQHQGVTMNHHLYQGLASGGGTNNNDDIATLLREIRDELRVNNGLLQNNAAGSESPAVRVAAPNVQEVSE